VAGYDLDFLDERLALGRGVEEPGVVLLEIAVTLVLQGIESASSQRPFSVMRYSVVGSRMRWWPVYSTGSSLQRQSRVRSCPLPLCLVVSLCLRARP
jgi:hypothetical protein